MFTRSISDYKTDMILALESWKSDQDTDRIVAQILEASSQIQTLDAKRFSSQIHKLLLCRMPERAKRLVEVLSETEPTRTGIAVLGFVAGIIKVLPVVIVVFLAWLVLR